MTLDDLHRVERDLLLLLGLDLRDDVGDVGLVLFFAEWLASLPSAMAQAKHPSLHPEFESRNRTNGRIGRGI